MRRVRRVPFGVLAFMAIIAGASYAKERWEEYHRQPAYSVDGTIVSDSVEEDWIGKDGWYYFSARDSKGIQDYRMRIEGDVHMFDQRVNPGDRVRMKFSRSRRLIRISKMRQ